MYKPIGLEQISKIEYAECKTEADMYVLEIYLINILKPVKNCDDKSLSKLTIKVEDYLEWKIWDKPKLIEKWKRYL